MSWFCSWYVCIRSFKWDMMKSVKDYSIIIQRLWVCHQALLRLGFKSDDIYVYKYDDVINGEEFNVLNCVLKAQSKEFTVCCGYYQKGGIDLALVEWNDFVQNYNSKQMKESELNDLFENWPFNEPKAGFVIALISKGFKIPALHE